MGIQDRDYYKEWLRERERKPSRFSRLRRFFRRRPARVLTPWQRNFRAALALLVMVVWLVAIKRYLSR